MEPLSIVLAEDDDGHATLVQRNLERGGIVNRIVHVRDGRIQQDERIGQHRVKSRVQPDTKTG